MRAVVDDRLVVIPPSIDPFSAKNRELDADTVRNILATVGLVSGVDVDGTVRFDRPTCPSYSSAPMPRQRRRGA